MSILRPDFRLEPSSCYVDARCPRYRVVVPAEEDLAPLMPYLNAAARVVYYDPGEPVLIFRLGRYKVAVRRDHVQVAPVSDLEEGRRARDEAEAFLEEILRRRGEIQPRFEPRRLPPALTIYRYLPRTNCGRCGEPSCLAFAAKLSSGEAELKDCPPLQEAPHSRDRRKLEELLGEG
ncbi:(Fe-S)-binding protein [Thermosulfurimonas sp. F29]|uniref:(Fe-S)-binding protein n=1 Tax=Thermosulfurimonas sp. F29 TaxID=2867247 RepID=UPI001C83875D|nr:(Fe-S)-binding protein [Thermosulfurimonas sp. F29]MBX6423969.1 hypothetical protein [Thermosulfurimonas sp. F29]